jgi:hypothetical protein
LGSYSKRKYGLTIAKIPMLTDNSMCSSDDLANRGEPVAMDILAVAMSSDETSALA